MKVRNNWRSENDVKKNENINKNSVSGNFNGNSNI